jgi:hypothetical protein
MAVYHASTSDAEKLQALRGLAMEGATDRAALDDLRSGHPEAVEDIETMVEVTSITGPDAEERSTTPGMSTPSRRGHLTRSTSSSSTRTRTGPTPFTVDGI